MTNSAQLLPHGLTNEEAAVRLKQEGYNELPSMKRQGFWALAWAVIQEPMFLFLISAGLIYVALGEPQDATILLSSVFFIIAITFYQKNKTERAIDALKELSSPRALVIRNGEQKRIPGREVVKGDLVLLSEGDRVPADGAVLSANNLSLDESLLTGESVPVRKSIWDKKLAIMSPGGEDHPFVYSGTLVVQGQGIIQILSTGVHTEMGKIGKSLTTLEEESTPLKQEINELVRRLAFLGLSLCIVVALLYGLLRNNWIDGFLAGVTLAMALLPEEFPVILTIFLALGAWRMSKHQVLARKTQAIETLGSATVLCVDKTGTLTLNKMSVQQILSDKTEVDVLEYAALASQKEPFDPMEKAIWEALENTSLKKENYDSYILRHEYPLKKELFAISRVWQSPNNEHLVVAAKGAPEAIIELCGFDKSSLEEVLLQVQVMAKEGLRVLGVAKSTWNSSELPKDPHDFSFEFLGLLGFMDPVRPNVSEAIQSCYQAGIRVIIITGDYPATAQTIARQIGLNNPDEVITGGELSQMDSLLFQQRIQNVNVFARMVPEQKLRLVETLKENRQIVAMTGDGVNDAPALKTAHIGIAMGKRGTDVAREAASLVLLDDDFSSIVEAIRQGRRIFDNLRKAIAYLISVHVPIAGISTLPILFNLPLILLPVHIVFLEFIIDPACSLVFEGEAEEKNVMARPPRNINESILNRRSLVISLCQGLLILIIAFLVYIIALHNNQGDLDARALSFTILIAGNLSLILSDRSWTRSIWEVLKNPNKAMWWVFAGALAMLGLTLYLPELRHIFHFSVLHVDDLLLCIAAFVVMIALFEQTKHFRRI